MCHVSQRHSGGGATTVERSMPIHRGSSAARALEARAGKEIIPSVESLGETSFQPALRPQNPGPAKALPPPATSKISTPPTPPRTLPPAPAPKPQVAARPDYARPSRVAEQEESRIERNRKVVTTILEKAISVQGNYGGKHKKQEEDARRWKNEVLNSLHSVLYGRTMNWSDLARTQDLVIIRVKNEIETLFKGTNTQVKYPKFFSQ